MPGAATRLPGAEATAARPARPWRGILSVTVLALLIATLTAGVSAWRSERHRESSLRPVEAAAAAFPVPAGAAVAYPTHVGTQPVQVVRGWTASGSLEEACAAWTAAFRTWVGQEHAAAITSRDVPGSSCSMAAPRSGALTTLQVAAYGGKPPQVTLSLSR